jgi:hypothetical protein
MSRVFRTLIWAERRPALAWAAPLYELVASGPAPIASEALERIAGLYAIEKAIRGLSADDRRAVRQAKSRPILDDLEPWLRASSP